MPFLFNSNFLIIESPFISKSDRNGFKYEVAVPIEVVVASLKYIFGFCKSKAKQEIFYEINTVFRNSIHE